MKDEANDAEPRRLRTENAELKRLLEKHQCGSLCFTPTAHVLSVQVRRRRRGRGHRPGCAITEALARAK